MKELIIDTQKEEVSIALLEDKKLSEFSRDDLKQSYEVGNIYIGRVKKIMAGLNAVFIHIGGNKEAFIHYHDLGENFPMHVVPHCTSNKLFKNVLNERAVGVFSGRIFVNEGAQKTEAYQTNCNMYIVWPRRECFPCHFER